jgi:hypothetical protein
MSIFKGPLGGLLQYKGLGGPEYNVIIVIHYDPTLAIIQIRTKVCATIRQQPISEHKGTTETRVGFDCLANVASRFVNPNQRAHLDRRARIHGRCVRENSILGGLPWLDPWTGDSSSSACRTSLPQIFDAQRLVDIVRTLCIDHIAKFDSRRRALEEIK